MSPTPLYSLGLSVPEVPRLGPLHVFDFEMLLAPTFEIYFFMLEGQAYQLSSSGCEVGFADRLDVLRRDRFQLVKCSSLKPTELKLKLDSYD